MKSLGPRKNGIYVFRLDGKPYVGKDNDIHKLKRIKQHISSLKRGDHWNKGMQESFDKGGIITYEVLEIYAPPIPDNELCEREIYYIRELKSKTEGFNLTDGGIGGNGIIYTPEQLEGKSDRVTGDRNPMSKITLEDFKGIVAMLMDNKNNKEIGERYNLHDRYVSSIRNKHRYKKWFALYFPDYIVVSGRQFQNTSAKLTNDEVKNIYIEYYTKNNNMTELAKKYHVSRSTVSLIVNKKTYKGVTSHIII